MRATARLSWRILLGTPTGFGAPLDTGLVTATSHQDHSRSSSRATAARSSCVAVNGYWHVAGLHATAASPSPTRASLPDGEYGAADFDGDGLADLVGQVGGTTPTFSVRRNVATRRQAPCTVHVRADGASLSGRCPSMRQSDSLGQPARRRPQRRRPRRPRRAHLHSSRIAIRGSSPRRCCRTASATRSPSASERQLWQESMVTMGDWNADGCSDIVQVRSVFISELRRRPHRDRHGRDACNRQHAVHGDARRLERRRPDRPPLHRCGDPPVVRRALHRRRRGARRQYWHRRARVDSMVRPRRRWRRTDRPRPTATATTATGCATTLHAGAAAPPDLATTLHRRLRHAASAQPMSRSRAAATRCRTAMRYFRPRTSRARCMSSVNSRRATDSAAPTATSSSTPAHVVHLQGRGFQGFASSASRTRATA